MEIYTIGFTQTTAEHFFDRLADAKVKRLLDVRLNNTSQLAGFAKAADLEFFLRRVGRISYAHEPLLAPTAELLGAYRRREIDWDSYERQFVALMAERKIHKQIARRALNRRTALLCSEATAECCHRRLVCEYLADHWSDIRMEHL